jgi:hypothetical protein
MSDFTQDIRPGDVINIQGPVPVLLKELFWDLAINFAIRIIEETQRKVFCTVLGRDAVKWRDNHTMLYLGENTVFSCQPPKALLLPLSEFDAEPKRLMSVYRLNPKYFGRELNPDDLDVFSEAARKIIGWNLDYDIGQNATILVNTLAGYPYATKTTIFDADGIHADKNANIRKSKQHLICATSVAAIIAYWRHEMKKKNKEIIPQPWKRLNPGAWTDEFRREYPGHWDCGSTFPAMFACSDTNFAEEFIHIGHYLKGKRTGA